MHDTKERLSLLWLSSRYCITGPRAAVRAAQWRKEEEAMTVTDLPAIMGTVLIVAGLALVGIYTRFRTEGSEKSVQAGALLIVVGAVLLGLSLFVPHAK
jgi:hypothetical protein